MGRRLGVYVFVEAGGQVGDIEASLFGKISTHRFQMRAIAGGVDLGPIASGEDGHLGEAVALAQLA